MGRPRILTDEQDEHIAKQYQQGASTMVLAEELGVSSGTVVASLRRSDVELRPKAGALKAKTKNGKRRCVDCGEWKPLSEYHKARGSNGKAYHLNFCRPCRNDRYKHHNPDPERAREKQLWSCFRMTVKDYDKLFKKQKGRCAVCKEKSDRTLAVDHDHNCCPGKKSCGKCVRSLLCSSCNNMLGCARDSIKVLKSAIAYLEKHNG